MRRRYNRWRHVFLIDPRGQLGTNAAISPSVDTSCRSSRLRRLIDTCRLAAKRLAACGQCAQAALGRLVDTEVSTLAATAKLHFPLGEMKYASGGPAETHRFSGDFRRHNHFSDCGRHSPAWRRLAPVIRRQCCRCAASGNTLLPPDSGDKAAINPRRHTYFTPGVK
jgi:hypothetical protein